MLYMKRSRGGGYNGNIRNGTAIGDVYNGSIRDETIIASSSFLLCKFNFKKDLGAELYKRLFSTDTLVLGKKHLNHYLNSLKLPLKISER